MRVVRCLILSALASLAAGGCSMFETALPTTAKPILPKPLQNNSLTFPYDRTFVAVSYKDQQFKDDRPSILVSTGFRGTGFSACNNWSATVLPRNDQGMVVGPIAVSKRVCDKRLMHNEQVFLFVLQTARGWTFDGKTLVLDSQQYGKMSFEPAA